ncbi:CpsD/CapB family tyrosine-protein kinase [Fictibacillus aquaticus]|uniref:Non-specific protein-tyrosine kinase n=1 Tax=Fictibacillus aquaticus TaxID=2021314 RepID=A0A235F8W3_9BACL|nr:CpsD/CapB family tyrosine-protein kinase [Fictibacillus aquaticus]OYD57718.1 hypothetical protein CGZ90_13725 [Fictibacillus aquaticus]
MFSPRKEKSSVQYPLTRMEQIRMVRTNLESRIGKGKAAILVTSPGGAEQQGLITAKLGAALAEQGKNVLLIDANLREPSLHDYFSTRNHNGFTECMERKEFIIDHVHATFINRVALLTAGNGSALLQHDRIKTIVDAAKSMFDCILIDAPGFLRDADAGTLISSCDGAVLVVKTNKTKRKELSAVKQHFLRTEQTIYGVICQTG